MTAHNLEQFVYQKPFKPFRLLLDDGEQITVRRPRRQVVSGDQLALVGETRKPGGAGVERFRIIRVDSVRSVEAVETR